MRFDGKRRKDRLEPWYGAVVPVLCEFTIAFAVAAAALCMIESGQRQQANSGGLDADHYSANVSAPLA